MKIPDRWVIFIATGCFSGKSPIAPGTIGSLLGLPLCIFLAKYNLWISIAVITGFILFAICIAGEAARLMNSKDPGCIVIDEIAGIMVTFLNLDLNLLNITSGFFLFRFFDIVKPFPVRYVEKRIKGGAGIVLDDLLAGVYSHVFLKAMLYVCSH